MHGQPHIRLTGWVFWVVTASLLVSWRLEW